MRAETCWVKSFMTVLYQVWCICWGINVYSRSAVTLFITMHFNITLLVVPRCERWFLSFRFTDQNSYSFFFSPIRTTFLAHLIILDFQAPTQSRQQYKL
jgi:hypothetical protein